MTHTSRVSALCEQVCVANLELAKSGLVTGTFGNLSALDRVDRIFAIKPSGVPYDELTPEHIVAISLDTGEVVGGHYRPSSDTPTHLRALSRVRLRRHCPYAFGIRDDVRASQAQHPLHGDDSCGLFSR